MAVKAFSEALKVDGTNSRFYNNLALALCKLERYQEGFEAFKKEEMKRRLTIIWWVSISWKGKIGRRLRLLKKRLK